MLKIQISMLNEGQFVDNELYDKDGNIVLHKGVKITGDCLASLRQQNVSTLYLMDDFQDRELEKILSAEFKLFDNIDIDLPGPDTPPIPNIIPQFLTELKSVQAGKKGLMQLMESKKCETLDKITGQNITAQPTGIPLKKNLRETQTGKREELAKIQFKTSYEEALVKTRSLLDNLASGILVSLGAIRHVTGQLIQTFLMDKDFLLNLSTIKTTEGDYVYNHSLNTSILSINIAASYGFNEQQVVEIGMGALLHDVGMLLIPSEIRFKKDRITEDEWYEIQKHPILGVHILERIDRLPPAVTIPAYQSHERENGKGYPKQRSTRLIHPYAKICAIADVFEALTAPRAYRNPNIPYKAMESVIKMTRQGLLSGEYVKALLEYTSLFPVGSLVELSNGLVAKVVQSNGTSFAKPKVCVLTEKNGNVLPEEKQYYEDLSKNTTIQIVRASPATTAIIDLLRGF
ncbi:MAG: HD domain-containing protein [Chitinispirillaceae bacterium]|nr:HD domain-containing protein [Chitinispirillaceae bacterium]